MNRKYKLDWSIIRRKIDGTLSDMERKELQDWINQDARRKKIVESAERYYVADELPEISDGQVDKAWERFRGSGQRVERKIYRHVIQWGAAAVIFIALGMGGWFYRAISDEADISRMAETVISRGDGKACLILSDGKVVNLDMAGSLRLTDRQANIRLDSTGVTYEGVTDQKEAVFNTLRIPQGGEYCLALSDGTKVWLNSKTDLTYPVAFIGGERRVRLNGEAYFEVIHNEKLPFIVETDKMEVKVLGTSFNVNSYRDEPQMITTLVSGSIQIQEEDKVIQRLRPSEQAIVDRASGEMVVRQVNTSAFVQWREGKFVFRNNDLGSIMRILSRWYDMDYEFADPDLKSERFYGLLSRYSEVKELLEQLEKTGRVHFVLEGKKVIVKK